jgi:hypothetical protein
MTIFWFAASSANPQTGQSANVLISLKSVGADMELPRWPRGHLELMALLSGPIKYAVGGHFCPGCDLDLVPFGQEGEDCMCDRDNLKKMQDTGSKALAHSMKNISREK